MIAIQQFAIEFGIMVSFWIDYGCNYIVSVIDMYQRKGSDEYRIGRYWRDAKQDCVVAPLGPSIVPCRDLARWNDIHALHTQMAGASRKRG